MKARWLIFTLTLLVGSSDAYAYPVLPYRDHFASVSIIVLGPILLRGALVGVFLPIRPRIRAAFMAMATSTLAVSIWLQLVAVFPGGSYEEAAVWSALPVLGVEVPFVHWYANVRESVRLHWVGCALLIVFASLAAGCLGYVLVQDYARSVGLSLF